MSLPGWVDPLFEAGEMRAADAWAIEEQEVPSLDLMERAGVGLARVTAAAASAAGPVRIVIGKGNNGGDGLVVARLLREEGREVDVLAVGDPAELEGDPKANLERLPGAQPQPFSAAALEESAAVVDALLGTGFEGEPREPVAGAIAAINAQDAPVVACDVPSGVNASTGEVEGEAVRAVATATFHGSKIGLHVAPGAFHAGEVAVVEIGIPRGAPGAQRAGLIGESVLDLFPRRTREGTKFSSGVVVVVGGSMGLNPSTIEVPGLGSGSGSPPPPSYTTTTTPPSSGSSSPSSRRARRTATATDRSAPRVSLRLARQQTLGRVLRRGLPVSVRCSEACRFRVDLVGRSGAVARASGRLRAAGTRTVRLRFTARARARLRTLSSLRARLRVRAVDARGNHRTVTRRLSLAG